MSAGLPSYSGFRPEMTPAATCSVLPQTMTGMGFSEAIFVLGLGRDRNSTVFLK